MKIKRGIKTKVAALIIMISLTFGLSEGALRIIFPDKLKSIDERSLLYEYDEELGWFPIKNFTNKFTGSRTIEVRNNHLGFRDDDHGPKRKKRILFLGDSFTWGYDVEKEERFTEKLQNEIPDWEIINLGISGYGTDQEFILLKKYYDLFDPDIVFLVFTMQNDTLDNLAKVIHGGYYKPYFELKNKVLFPCDFPIKKSYRYLIKKHPILGKSYTIHASLKIFQKITEPANLVRNPTNEILIAMNKYVGKKGAQFIIGFTEKSKQMIEKELCENNKIKHLYLTTDFRYQSHGNHWTTEGHTVVSAKILRYLKENYFLDF